MRLRRLVLLALAVAIAAAYVAWGAGGRFGRTRHQSAADPPQPVGDPVLIDPGHGGVDGGVKVDGLLEKDVNLQVSLKLADALRELGVPAAMTRDVDRHLSPDRNGRAMYSGRHREDLKARWNAARETGAWGMVSIHANFGGHRENGGTIVFHGQDRPLSRALAESICAEIRAAVAGRRCEVDPQRLYLLANPDLPVVLVETAYLSHPGDRELILRDEFQALLTAAIARGIERVWRDFQPLTP